jgi:hypothetical protein
MRALRPILLTSCLAFVVSASLQCQQADTVDEGERDAEYEAIQARSASATALLRSADIPSVERGRAELAGVRTALRSWADRYGVSLVSVGLIAGDPPPDIELAKITIGVPISPVGGAHCHQEVLIDGEPCTLTTADVGPTGKWLYCEYDCPDRE